MMVNTKQFSDVQIHGFVTINPALGRQNFPGPTFIHKTIGDFIKNLKRLKPKDAK